jgi:hypothetical protein
LTRKSLQPIVCCLGDDVGGNPTQFVLERAFTDRALSDWKLFSAEIRNEQIGEALAAFELLGIDSVLLLTDPMRSLVLGESLPVVAQPLAKWCGRATLLQRLTTDAVAEEKPADNASAAAEAEEVRRPTWEASYSAGSAILQSILGSKSLGMNDPTAIKELSCLVLGDSPIARAAVATLVHAEISRVWWKVGESVEALQDQAPPAIIELIQTSIADNRLKISPELPDDTDITYDTVLLTDDRGTRELEKWLAREPSYSNLGINSQGDSPGRRDAQRIVYIRKDIFSLSPSKLAAVETAQTIHETDWLAKMLEEDFLRFTGVASNPAVVRDALDEYLEL